MKIKDKLANIFTKSLKMKKFEMMCTWVGIQSVEVGGMIEVKGKIDPTLDKHLTAEI